jgi:hypothetical protein
MTPARRKLVLAAKSSQPNSRAVDLRGHSRQGWWKRPARDLPAQHWSDLALEQLERGAVLFPGEAVTVGVYMEHLVPHLRVVPKYLVDDLLRAADQGRTALDGVLEGMEHWLNTAPAHCRQAGLEYRAVRRDGVL